MAWALGFELTELLSIRQRYGWFTEHFVLGVGRDD
jgi:hypothetical protein